MDDQLPSHHKDIRIYQTQKAEAEVTILYLARLAAQKSVPQTNSDDNDGTKAIVQEKLKIANQQNHDLSAQLEEARRFIALLISNLGFNRSIAAPCRSCSAKGSSQVQDLIDLDNAVHPSDTYGSGSEQTLVQKSDESINDDDDVQPSAIHDSSLPASLTQTSYIHRFQNQAAQSTGSAERTTTATRSQSSGFPLIFSNTRPNAASSGSLSVEVSGPSCPNSTSSSFSENAPLKEPFLGDGEDSDEKGQLICDAVLVRQRKALAKWKKPGDLMTFDTISSDQQNISPDLSKASLTPRSDLLSCKPRWKIGPDVFVDAPERLRSLAKHKASCEGEDIRFPDFFRYRSIRYMPSKDCSDLYRTVVISNLPEAITLNAILDQVRGGSLVEAKLLDTMSITGHQTALLVFVHEHGAFSLADRAAKIPLSFGPLVAKIDVVQTPTWPLNPRYANAIFSHQQTRCLELRDFPPGISIQGLCKEVKNFWPKTTGRNLIVRAEFTGENVVSIEFSSIQSAGYAFGRLANSRDYRQCKVHLVNDPCARPWGTQKAPKKPEETQAASEIEHA